MPNKKLLQIPEKLKEKFRKKKETIPEPEPEPEYVFDEVLFDEAILYNENRGAIERGENPYEVKGKTGDLGKYQVSPDFLDIYGLKWTGKVLTPEEFLEDEEAQEVFYERFKRDVVDKYKLKEKEALVAWHNGIGAIGDLYQTDGAGKIIKDEKGKEVPVTYEYNRDRLMKSINDAVRTKPNVQKYINNVEFLFEQKQ